tara:strand:+ start:228 stop:449 length:222 start_codon:yes stop_codon:yes gene_type:complete
MRTGLGKRYVTKEELFIWQAPSFNFELSADQLLARALEVGFVKQAGYDQDDVNLRKAVYEVNNDYNHLGGNIY